MHVFCVLCFSHACVVPPITARGGIKVCPLYRCAIIVHLSARPLHLSWCAIRRWGGDTQHTAAFCIGSRRMPCDRLPSVVVIEKRCAQTIARERVSICSQHGSRARAGRERDWYTIDVACTRMWQHVERCAQHVERCAHAMWRGALTPCGEVRSRMWRGAHTPWHSTRVVSALSAIHSVW